jgi:predicted transcriptional regulator
VNEEEDLIRISNAEMMGRVAERERIIKLLKEHPCFSLETCQQGCLAHDLLVANISLIKGEQK